LARARGQGGGGGDVGGRGVAGRVGRHYLVVVGGGRGHPGVTVRRGGAAQQGHLGERLAVGGPLHLDPGGVAGVVGPRQVDLARRSRSRRQAARCGRRVLGGRQGGGAGDVGGRGVAGRVG